MLNFKNMSEDRLLALAVGGGVGALAAGATLYKAHRGKQRHGMNLETRRHFIMAPLEAFEVTHSVYEWTHFSEIAPTLAVAEAERLHTRLVAQTLAMQAGIFVASRGLAKAWDNFARDHQTNKHMLGHGRSSFSTPGVSQGRARGSRRHGGV